MQSFDSVCCSLSLCLVMSLKANCSGIVFVTWCFHNMTLVARICKTNSYTRKTQTYKKTCVVCHLGFPEYVTVTQRRLGVLSFSQGYGWRRKRKSNWIGHILRRNYLLQRVTEGKIQGGIEVTGRQGRRRRKLLDDLKERRRYSHLKEEALDRTMWRARFGRGFGPVVRQTTEWMNDIKHVCDNIFCVYCKP